MDETIVAIITPPGMGAIAALRISGRDSFKIANSIFSKDISQAESHRALYGKIFKSDGSTLDNVLLLPMHNPNSYTGEDVVEIFTHGGNVIAPALLDLIIKKGARIARPGEFTSRAYENKKMDLAQAEAVQALIAADNSAASELAFKQLEGELSMLIKRLQNRLIEIIAQVEVMLDFSNDHLPTISFERALKQIEQFDQDLLELADSYKSGRRAFEGAKLALVGAPNVGKSSLMNLLCQKDVAIVTEQEGTTRDLVSKKIRIDELYLEVIDTAGIRSTSDKIEKIGIAKAKEAIKEADLVLLIVDKENLSDFDKELLKNNRDTIVVRNKIDLPESILNPDHINISVEKEINVGHLKERIREFFFSSTLSSGELPLINLRHRESLLEAHRFCQEILNSPNGHLECMVENLRIALNHLSEILEIDSSEKILDKIFSNFCLGK